MMSVEKGILIESDRCFLIWLCGGMLQSQAFGLVLGVYVSCLLALLKELTLGVLSLVLSSFIDFYFGFGVWIIIKVPESS